MNRLELFLENNAFIYNQTGTLAIISKEDAGKTSYPIVSFDKLGSELSKINRVLYVDKHLKGRFIKEEYANTLIRIRSAIMLAPKCYVSLLTNYEKIVFTKEEKEVFLSEHPTCYYCDNPSSCVVHKDYEKHKSPCITVCNTCLQKTATYIYGWLNIKSTIRDIWYIEAQHSKIKNPIHPHFAKKLVDEGMAIFITKNSIRLRFRPKKFNKMILTRDHHSCHYCGLPGNTIDHLVPRSEGGLTTPENCVCSCQDCNMRKGERSYEEFVNEIKQKDAG